ncbi:hypothetical protein JOD02_001842 [Caldicoprobacter guelmensis]|nr:hypothetical protein [Caldicoprobacter guelmensis]
MSNIVETYKINNTTIKICDDAYKNKTSEDIQAILKRITHIRLQTIYRKSTYQECRKPHLLGIR